MLRTLFGLLLLANLLFFGWAQGWFAPVWSGPNAGVREPTRLAAQVNPEAVVVRAQQGAGASTEGAARPLAAATLACLEAGPYSDAEIDAAQTALEQAGLPPGSWVRDQVQAQTTWLVFAGRYPDPKARAAREEELRQLGLAFETIEAPPELAPGFALSRHASRDAAELALASVANRPISGVRVVALPPPPLLHWLRAPSADAELQQKLAALGRGFRPCAARP